MTAALLIGLGLAVSRWDVPVESPTGRREVTSSDRLDQERRLRREIADLRAQADAAEGLARRMIALRRRRVDLAAMEAKLAAPDPLELVRRQLDRAPAIMVRSAVRLQYEYGLFASAAEAYRRTMNLFPDSPWAQVARRRQRFDRLIETVTSLQQELSDRIEAGDSIDELRKRFGEISRTVLSLHDPAEV